MDLYQRSDYQPKNGASIAITVLTIVLLLLLVVVLVFFILSVISKRPKREGGSGFWNIYFANMQEYVRQLSNCLVTPPCNDQKLSQLLTLIQNETNEIQLPAMMQIWSLFSKTLMMLRQSQGQWTDDIETATLQWKQQMIAYGVAHGNTYSEQNWIDMTTAVRETWKYWVTTLLDQQYDDKRLSASINLGANSIGSFLSTLT